MLQRKTQPAALFNRNSFQNFLGAHGNSNLPGRDK